MNHIASRKENVRKNTASERSELHVALQHCTVGKNRKVEHTHSCPEFCGMQVYEFTVLEIAAVKAFVGKIYVFKSDSACVEAYDLLVLVYVIINLVLDLLRVGVVIQTIILPLGNFAVVVEYRDSRFFTPIKKALVLLKHFSYSNALFKCRQ